MLGQQSQQLGAGRLWVQAPTLDNGSDWYAMRSGEVSQPGLMVFSVTADGWDDRDPLWLRLSRRSKNWRLQTRA